MSRSGTKRRPFRVFLIGIGLLPLVLCMIPMGGCALASGNEKPGVRMEPVLSTELPLSSGSSAQMDSGEEENRFLLPDPACDSGVRVVDAMAVRKSERTYSEQPISLEDLSCLLWAAQGTVGEEGRRTVPSAGALYPLSVLVLAERVEGLPAGLYRYLPQTGELAVWQDGDPAVSGQALQKAALDQPAIGLAPVVLVITGDPTLLERKYGSRAERFTIQEAGHASQNVYLMAEALSLGTVVIGGYSDESVASVLRLPETWMPLSLMPVGHPAAP